MKQLLTHLSQQLRPVAAVTPESPTISRLEKELIAEKQRPAVVCAVAVLLFPVAGKLQLTLILRPTYEGGVHSGQIAFPGGKKDPTDANLLETALRECCEEIGVEIDPAHFLGALPDIYIVPSHSVVTPFVAFLPTQPVYTPDKREVAKVLEFDLSHFFNPDVYTLQDIKIGENKTWKLPCYQIDEHIIWGATARMIQDFTKLVGEENFKQYIAV